MKGENQEAVATLRKLKNRFRHWRLKKRLTRPVIRIERKVNREFIQKALVPADPGQREKSG